VQRDLPNLPRDIPSLQRLLERSDVRILCEAYGRTATLGALRAEVDALRSALLSGRAVQADVATLVQRVVSQMRARQLPSLVPVINATGVVLHTNLGRAPLAPAAAAAAARLAGCYSNLEFDLATGKRGSRTSHAAPVIARLTGAESALVVNNGAAAVLLALAALARDGEVIVSRGELIEIGGSFRLHEVVAQSGARLVEVGSTNKTRIADYERALTPATRVILKSHPSNYRIVGFTAAPSRGELAALAQARGVALVEDLGSGSLVDLTRYGLPAEPTVQACLAEGVDLVTFSGDKLLGGPQAGVLAGRASLVERAARHPLARAVRADKMTLAALGATLSLYESGRAEREVPALSMLALPVAVLRRRARRLGRALTKLDGLRCEVADDTSVPGGGSLPLATLRTAVVRLEAQKFAAHLLAERLLKGDPPLVTRVARDRVVVDVRTVFAEELRHIPRLVAAALA